MLIKMLNELSTEQLNKVPAGFNNNIIWNAAHMVAAQQGICYKRSGEQMKIEEDFFQAYKPDTKPEKFSFQINTIDLRQPSEFLKIGEMVPKTKFKLEKFEFKTQLNTNTNEQEDVSELTITNTETDEKIILVYNRVTDSPDFFMRFIYEWTNPPLEFTVKKRGEFRLKPNVNDVYKLVDSQEGKGVIQTPDGKKIEILPDPRLKK